ncbi:unnamed protein product [Somion occarium]|uniref:KOW domain-containing protein n=1 Tax=Somion occarium TaxID=3059160 RepID=A0ABP1DCV0_9APHY
MVQSGEESTYTLPWVITKFGDMASSSFPRLPQRIRLYSASTGRSSSLLPPHPNSHLDAQCMCRLLKFGGFLKCSHSPATSLLFRSSLESISLQAVYITPFAIPWSFKPGSRVSFFHEAKGNATGIVQALDNVDGQDIAIIKMDNGGQAKVPISALKRIG